MMPKNTVDPLDPENWDIPLWCVYGHVCFPQIFCCKVNNVTGTPCIWGYSIYKGKPGFRTLGRYVSDWVVEQEYDVYFFKDKIDAFVYLDAILTPIKGKD